MRRTAVVSLAATAAGHAVMYEPPVRSSRGVPVGGAACAGGSCNWYTDQAAIGCADDCTLPCQPIPVPDLPCVTTKPHGKSCCNPKPVAKGGDIVEPTILDNDTDLRTYCLGDKWACTKTAVNGLALKTHPWRKPGSAGIHSPCGLSAGDPPGGAASGLVGYAPSTVPIMSTLGDDGRDHPKLLKQTVWIAGSTAEVAWAVDANHGGGYSYRLCPAGGDVTEACFQKTPLDFVGASSWLQHSAFDPSNRTEIPAAQVSVGTVPTGSQWRKNPIPGCTNGIIGFVGGIKCEGPQFEPPLPGIYGLGQGSCFGKAGPTSPDLTACVESPDQVPHGSVISNTGIVDKVRVPDLPPGDYVLGFRWDCEQTPQVWASCADITIKASGQATKPFTPMSGCEPCCAETKGQCANCSSCLNDKTGACAACWEAKSTSTLSGLLAADYMLSCLGNEAPDGSAPTQWPAGSVTKPWSPGCAKCWADKDACTPSER